MSYYIVEPPRKTRLARRFGVAAIVLVLAVAVGAGYAVGRPLTVTVDGVETVIEPGTTVADLRRQGVFKAPSGDLIAVNGTVAKKGAGAPARLLRNGGPTDPSQKVYRGDVLVSREGEDRNESVEVTEVAIAYGKRFEGEGPIPEVVSAGKPGRKRVTRGVESLIELSAEVLLVPEEEVVRLTQPRPGMKLVALTFDDGPWPKHTEQVLDALKAANVKATFFVLGRQVKRYPKIMSRIDAEGHLFGGHSYSHKRFSELPPGKIRNEVQRCNAAIRTSTGESTMWIRPPYGSMDETAWSEVRKLGAHVVLWDVDSEDWQKPGARKIVKSVIKDTRPGSIILMHDGGGDRKQTVQALPHIIRGLKAKGYVFVTVADLVRAEGVRKDRAAVAAAANRPKRY